MAKEKNTELKSAAYAEQHGLRDKVTMANSSIKIDDDLYEAIVLADAGVTMDQFKKIQKGGAQLFEGVNYVAGELAAEEFKNNPEAAEIGWSYKIGQGVTASGIYSRGDDGKVSIVNAIETRVESAEMKRVHAHLADLFDNINS